jgi:hypothetical protein
MDKNNDAFVRSRIYVTEIYNSDLLRAASKLGVDISDQYFKELWVKTYGIIVDNIRKAVDQNIKINKAIEGVETGGNCFEKVYKLDYDSNMKDQAREAAVDTMELAEKIKEMIVKEIDKISSETFEKVWKTAQFQVEIEGIFGNEKKQGVRKSKLKAAERFREKNEKYEKAFFPLLQDYLKALGIEDSEIEPLPLEEVVLGQNCKVEYGDDNKLKVFFTPIENFAYFTKRKKGNFFMPFSRVKQIAIQVAWEKEKENKGSMSYAKEELKWRIFHQKSNTKLDVFKVVSAGDSVRLEKKPEIVTGEFSPEGVA